MYALDNVSRLPNLQLSKQKPSHLQLYNQNSPLTVPLGVISYWVSVYVLLGVVCLSVVKVALDGVLVLVVWVIVLMSVQFRNLAPVSHSKHMKVPVNQTAQFILPPLNLSANPVLRLLFLTIVRHPLGLLVGNAQRLFGML